MTRTTPPRHVVFDRTPEIFASDGSGAFSFPLLVDSESRIDAAEFDEIRFVLSLWHPSNQRTIELDRAYVELRGSFDPEDERWIKLAEIEPVVSPYEAGATFDGWIVLPILAASSAFTVTGSGFRPRTRLQIRASAYLVA